MQKINMKKTIVISLGGSIIVPKEYDLELLKEFISILRSNLDKYRFIVCCGGGYICRKAAQVLLDFGITDHDERDRVGIKAICLNAEVVRALFEKDAYKDVEHDYDKQVEFDKVLICSAWETGHTSDFDAVKFSIQYGGYKLINLTNVDYIYDSDPKDNPSAKPLPKLTWQDYKDIFGDEYVPSMHAPFDPVASKLARDNDLSVYILKGMKNLAKVLNDEEFEGSLLSN